ncbi:MAG TPA: aldo/keto reductase [Caulobacteraceae bacterium]|jgi:aryl-alcohol dehydrogenase-like predicted oxidoreductase|nr:aldo/keto reductase [Caulobacteraceae bacterium]
MSTRRIAGVEIVEVGLGCMSLSHAYGPPTEPAAAIRLLQAALDLGYTLLDTASLYGGGANEALVGQALKGRRNGVFLATKGGLAISAEGKREINGRPETLKANCDESLKRLQTDVVDLYYQHRLDPKVPIEDSVGAMADLVEAGKVKAIGLSEVSAATLRRAHAVHPIAALQSEYSLWTRNAEVAALAACREIGAAYVAFSPVARGFLAGSVRDVETLAPGDIRRAMPRFQGEAFRHNLTLLPGYEAVAREVGCTMGQLALAWLLTVDEIIVPIPGTTRTTHLAENLGAAGRRLSPEVMARLDALINPRTVEGPRYNAASQADIDTEELVP